jgi:hypothetical protein
LSPPPPPSKNMLFQVFVPYLLEFSALSAQDAVLHAQIHA